MDVLDPPKGVSANPPGELDNLHATFDRLQGLLEAAHTYVADVVVSDPPHIEEQGMGWDPCRTMPLLICRLCGRLEYSSCPCRLAGRKET